MAREVSSGIRQSVLDRLLGSNQSGDESAYGDASFEQLRVSLCRDLEWLLNTRRCIVPVPDGSEELARSIFTFGVPDLTSMSKDDPETRRRLLNHFEEAIIRFEPRLTGVRVSIAPNENTKRREVHFVIEGMLRSDPMPEEVAFDTVMSIVTGEIDVKGNEDDE